jgi:Flp pilus assembly CpaE family ATPase
VRVLLAVPDPTVEAVLLRRLGRSDAGVTVVGRCLDLADLLAAAGRPGVDAVVVSDSVRHLDRDAVRTLHRGGLRVVVLASTDTHSGHGAGPVPRARRLGADAEVGSDPDDVLTALRSPLPPVAPEPADASPASQGEAGARGELVAVWGPIGSPGRTTTAVTLADEAARLGVSALLADADTYGASIALRLGLLDDLSGLAAACRAAGVGRLDPATLARAAQQLPTGLRVLTGLPRVDRWSELRPAALDEVWSVSRSLAALTVVDVGFGLEHDPEADFDPTVPERDGAARSTLAAADTVVCVARSDPAGMVRLLRALPDVRAVAPTARLQVVVVTASGGRRGHGPDVRRLLADRAAIHDPVVVPDDRTAVDAACWAGATLAEQAPASPARLVLADLAARLSGMPARRSGRRRPRRSA